MLSLFIVLKNSLKCYCMLSLFILKNSSKSYCMLSLVILEKHL
jgi:hypothetical protein